MSAAAPPHPSAPGSAPGVATPRVHALAGTLVVFASYLLVSALWSWPTARLDPDVLVTRQFDLLPTIWLLAAASAEPFSLGTTASAWPVGESLTRIDSYVILPLAWTLGRVLDARVLAGLLAWVGPALGALAAERCAARAFGVSRPASWVAGAMYGFSGITATALLEGHVYHAFNPWLPLLLWAAWRAQAEDGRWYHGFFAAGAWALALLTTGYAGVLGALLLVLVGLRGGVARLLAGMLVVGLPAGLLYLRLFEQGGGLTGNDTLEPDQILSMGSATLATLGGWSDYVDLRYHSIGAPVGWTGFGLLLLAPLVLRGRPAWRTLWGLAFFGLFVALGRYIRLVPGGDFLLSPVGLLVNVPGVEHFRFPVRITWLYALCGGIVAARVADVLIARLDRRLIAALLLLFVGDAVLGTGLPWRLRRQVGTIPSAYASAPADRAVLDLWALPLDRSSGELEMRTRALGCFYQSAHRRPTLEVCMGTNVASPRAGVDRWLTSRLLSVDPPLPELRARLADLGIGAVALHADVYGAGARQSLTQALTSAFGPPAAETHDGGEHVVLWVVPAPAASDPLGAWKSIQASR